MAKTPLPYGDMYLGGAKISAVYWGKDKIWKVPEMAKNIHRPLMVYAPETRDFTKNGFCALRPSAAEWELTFGAAGEITVAHPFDRNGKWKALQNANIILAPCMWHGVLRPQAFRIYRTVKSMDFRGSKSLTAYARHVFYDLNYSLLQNIAVNKRPRDGLEYLIESQMGYSGTPGGIPPYFYSLASDAWHSRDELDPYRNYYVPVSGNLRALNYQNCTLTEAIIGDGSISQIWNLEFYADNFYFSLRPVMEGSLQNSFNIRYAHDMMDVSEDADYTDAMTVAYFHDNFSHGGNGIAQAEERFGPYVRPIEVGLSYAVNPGESKYLEDCDLWFRSHNEPKISYTASYAPIDMDKSKNFLGQLDGREVGDTGTVTNADIGITTTQRIISKRVDLLTGITLNIKLGSLPLYLNGRTQWTSTATVGSPSAIEKQVEALRNA